MNANQAAQADGTSRPNQNEVSPVEGDLQSLHSRTKSKNSFLNTAGRVNQRMLLFNSGNGNDTNPQRLLNHRSNTRQLLI